MKIVAHLWSFNSSFLIPWPHAFSNDGNGLWMKIVKKYWVPAFHLKKRKIRKYIATIEHSKMHESQLLMLQTQLQTYWDKPFAWVSQIVLYIGWQVLRIVVYSISFLCMCKSLCITYRKYPPNDLFSHFFSEIIKIKLRFVWK